MPKATDIDIKADAVYAILVEGKTDRQAAKEFGVGRRSVARWKLDPRVIAVVEARRRLEGNPVKVQTYAEMDAPKPEHVAPPVVESYAAGSPIDEVTRTRLLDAIRELPMPIPMSLQLVGLSPRAYARWVAMSEHDEGIAQLVVDIRRAQAEAARELMRKWVNGTFRGNIGWALSKAIPPYYRDDIKPEDEKQVRDPGESLGRIMGKYKAKPGGVAA